MSDDLFDEGGEPASRLEITERRRGDVTILVLGGEMLVDDGDVALRQRIHTLADQGQVKIVVDLAGVAHIDSAGVGMTVRDLGGDVKLLHLTERSQRLLALMKIAQIFEVFEDEDEAVRSFGGG
jgi:anti-sigma B factor antagonist